MISIVDMRDDETMARFALKAAASGHIRTTTLKAFDEAGYRSILDFAVAATLVPNGLEVACRRGAVRAMR
jgi:type II secretory ATPase GspE/PulE/Tfp pilus assembly ATPase PilB-like protein